MTDERFGDAWRLERRDDGTRLLWFDRPGSSQNSLDVGTLTSLREAVGAVDADLNATILAIRSGKARGFCAGADLKRFREGTSHADLVAFGHLGISVFDAVESLDLPTVAVIHGPCVGGGLELALACRARIAIEGGGARLGSPEVNLGLIPGWDGVGRLLRLIGLDHALDLLLSGRLIDESEADRLGLLDAIFVPDRVDVELERLTSARALPTVSTVPSLGWEEALATARERVNTGPEAHKRAREILLDVVEADLTRGRDAGRQGAVIGLSTLAMSPEAREAIGSFFSRPERQK